MNKLIKGAVTGAAGIALLLGGAGTFAAWNDQASFGSADKISTGTMTVTTTGAAGWYDVTTTPWNSSMTPINPATFNAVPGDTIEYRQPVNVVADGAHLTAAVSFVNPTLTGADKADDFAISTSLAGATGTAGSYSVTTGSYTAVLDVTFKGTTVNKDDQGKTLNLSATQLNLTQTAPAK